MGSFVFISTNAGVNLYVGNHEDATGRFMLVTDIPEQHADLPPEEQEVAISNTALGEGLRFMFTHPWRELQLTATKLRVLYEDDEEGLWWIQISVGREGIGSVDLIADLAYAFYGAVLVASAGGLFYWARRRRSAVALPLLVVGVFTLGQLPFFAVPRFHFPMLPSFCLLAAVGAMAGVEYIRSAPANWRRSSPLPAPADSEEKYMS
jgi:hypothetical protein